MHILDIVQNSISAGATKIEVLIRIDTVADRLVLEVKDDGCGMSEEMVARVTSPFTTSRTTRKVGLGIPLVKQLADMTNGCFALQSKVGEGTVLRAEFQFSHLDLPPMGDLVGTMQSLLISAPEAPEFVLTYEKDGKSFVFDTREVRAALDGLPLDLPDVVAWMRDYLKEGFEQLSGGAMS